MAYKKLTAQEKREYTAPVPKTTSPAIQYEFHAQLAVGKKFEDEVGEALNFSKIGYRPATMPEQFLGYDFLTESGLKLECKLDTRDNGVIFIELTQGKTLGCIFTTTADVILFKSGNRVYFFTPLQIRLWFAKHCQNLPLKTVSTGSTGVLMPLVLSRINVDILNLPVALMKLELDNSMKHQENYGELPDTFI